MSNDRDKGVVSFGESDYAAKIAAAKADGPPLGGAPMPKIPRLDQKVTDRHAGVQAASQKLAMLTPEQQMQLQKEGKFIPGVGSGFAVNQPMLSKQEEAPEVANPPRPEGKLRPETLEGIKAFEDANKQDNTPEQVDKDLAAEVSKQDSDGFDYEEFGREAKSLLLNKGRRLAIEKRIVDTMDIEQLLVHQEIRQEVPIVPGRFFPTYRSTSGQEDLYVKRIINTETGSDMYVADKFAMLNLGLGLYAINRKPLLSHLDNNGDINEELFNKKMKQLLKYPITLLVDLSVNYIWFSKRVERLLVVDEITSF